MATATRAFQIHGQVETVEFLPGLLQRLNPVFLVSVHGHSAHRGVTPQPVPAAGHFPAKMPSQQVNRDRLANKEIAAVPFLHRVDVPTVAEQLSVLLQVLLLYQRDPPPCIQTHVFNVQHTTLRLGCDDGVSTSMLLLGSLPI